LPSIPEQSEETTQSEEHFSETSEAIESSQAACETNETSFPNPKNKRSTETRNQCVTPCQNLFFIEADVQALFSRKRLGNH